MNKNKDQYKNKAGECFDQFQVFGSWGKEKLKNSCAGCINEAS